MRSARWLAVVSALDASACLQVTANNVTCALYGDKLSFWHVSGHGPTWGCILAGSWRGGRIALRSHHRRRAVIGFADGQSYLSVAAGNDWRRAFFDATPERADAAPILHYFLRRGQSQQAEPMDDRLFALFYPLFGVGHSAGRLAA